MKKKRWILLLIIAFPSFFWLILETSSINSRKLPYYGPKKPLAKGDTLYYRTGSLFYEDKDLKQLSDLNRSEFPLYALVFIDPRYRKDAYRLTGLWEYLNYKTDKIRNVPVVLVHPSDKDSSASAGELKKLETFSNVHFRYWKQSSYDSLVRSYFNDKPYYIDYSFFILVDANRNLRGYYDGRYVSEIKRLIEEYRHLRLKEEKQILINENEIHSN